MYSNIYLYLAISIIYSMLRIRAFPHINHTIELLSFWWSGNKQQQQQLVMTTATMKMKQDTVRAIYYVWLYLYGRGKMFHTKNMDRKFKHILADQIKFGSTNGRNGTKNKHNSFRVAEAHCMVRDLPLCHYI